ALGGAGASPRPGRRPVAAAVGAAADRGRHLAAGRAPWARPRGRGTDPLRRRRRAPRLPDPAPAAASQQIPARGRRVVVLVPSECHRTRRPRPAPPRGRPGARGGAAGGGPGQADGCQPPQHENDYEAAVSYLPIASTAVRLLSYS